MKTWLAALLALVIGVVVGVFLGDGGSGRSGVQPPPVEAAQRTTQTDRPKIGATDRETRRALESLTLEVRNLTTLVTRLRDAADRGVSSGRREVPVEGLDSEREPAATRNPAADDGSTVDADELRDWMATIEERIDALIKSPGTLPVLELPPRGVRPSPLPPPRPDDADQEEYAASHLLWSYQDVINAYGRPDLVHDGDEWEYQFRGEVPLESELSDVHFVFRGGYVVHMYAH